MAYLISIGSPIKPERIVKALERTLLKDKRFKCRAQAQGMAIEIRNVRLTAPKEYCGQHPGECQATFGGGKKKRTTFLEWEDWVAFHGLVNDVLDDLKCAAEVTSKPMETVDRVPGCRVGYMYMRRGMMRRLRYEWREDYNAFGRVVRYWNPGSADQFELPHELD